MLLFCTPRAGVASLLLDWCLGSYIHFCCCSERVSCTSFLLPSPHTAVNVTAVTLFLLPMSTRSYEVGVFGATGYTGQRIVHYLAHLHSRGLYTKPILLAGRSESRLQSILSSLPSPSHPSAFHVLGGITTDSPASLGTFTSQVTIVINAAGPFRFLGPPVVRACIESSTHYVDVTGEPEFVERMIVAHDAEARAKGVRIVHACGFDSIPADVGMLQCVLEAQRRFGPQCGLSRVDSFITLHTGPLGARGAYGTWASLVHGLSNRSSLAGVRRQLKAKYSADGPTSIHRIGPAPKARLTQYQPSLHKHCLVLPSADASIVRNTQTQLTTRGYTGVLPYFTESITLPQRWWVWALMLWGVFLTVMTWAKWTQKLLLRWPRLFSAGMFSEEGPTQAQLDSTSLTFDLFASGYRHAPPLDGSSALPAPDVHLHVQLKMKEPGYVATPIFVVQSALAVLEAADGKQTMPVGVLTPGSAFKESELVARLEKEGLSFRVVDADRVA